MPAGRPRKYTSVEDMERDIERYFQECKVEGRPYTITGLALALDMDRDSLLNYEKNEDYKEFFGTVKRAKQKCQNYAEECLFTGKANIAGVIFNMKNNYGWVDKHEIDQTIKTPNVEIVFGKKPEEADQK